MCITIVKAVEKPVIPVNNLCTTCEWVKIKFSSNQIITDFIDYTGQKRKNVDNLKSYPTKTYKNIYFFLISSMIVPKNH